MARKIPQPFWRSRKDRPGQGCWHVQLDPAHMADAARRAKSGKDS